MKEVKVMSAADVRKLVQVGSRIRTIWDDEPRLANGEVVKRYRAHRGVGLVVEFDDGTTENVYECQVVKILK